jgi:hypothetical protein
MLNLPAWMPDGDRLSLDINQPTQRGAAQAWPRGVAGLAMALESDDHMTIRGWEAPLSDDEPIAFRPRQPAGFGHAAAGLAGRHDRTIHFNRKELEAILRVYGRRVAAGDWRDYALDFGSDKAVFSVFRHTSEVPLYRIEKCPRLARRQGAYSVVAATGLILKRGHDLPRVLDVLDRDVVRLVAV